MTTAEHPAGPQRFRPAIRVAGALAVLVAPVVLPLLAVVTALVGPAGIASAQSEPTVVIHGRGWGHGRGLSQHGALGYAVDHGWDWRRILDHYYSNTTEGTIGPAADPPVPATVGVGVSSRAGYWVTTSHGAVVPRDGAVLHGSMASQPLNSPVLGMAANPAGDGYWLVAGDGGIFSFGNAAFHGSTGGIPLNQPVVGMASSATGDGYWLVARDGGVFAFGDAGFFGSTGAIRLNQPIVGMAATPSGRGYWLVARDGGVFAFGDAGFFGSTGGIRLNQPVVGMAATPSGRGYWLVARDGGVFNFGDAVLHGSLPGRGVSADIVAVARSRGGNGYWLVDRVGQAHAFGDASVTISVRLTAQAGQDLIVWRPNGGLRTNAVGGLSSAVRVRAAGGGWLVDQGDTCAGPWTQVTPSPVALSAVEIAAADPRDNSSNHRDLLGLCRAEGVRFYRGQLHAYRDTAGVQTRNIVEMELYLRGVVPRESPASWGTLGGGRGMQALAAQSVAARSYAWAENRGPGARTCDTTSCQVYSGAFLLTGGTLTGLESSITNQAIGMTTGLIRLLNGLPARTEFSSSTGGWTAGGTFPAVPDVGDAYAGNRVHTWTEHVKVSAIQAAWPSIGTLTGIEVLSRNGLGEWGGRVLRVRVSGTAGSVEVSGDEFRSRLAADAACVTTNTLPQCMKSTWFNVASAVPMGPASTEPADEPAPADAGPAVPPADGPTTTTDQEGP